MAIMIVLTIFALLWIGTTLASITYLVFKNSKKLTRQLEEHPPFWLQNYYSFLNSHHQSLLIGSIVMGIGLTVWGINQQNTRFCDFDKPKVIVINPPAEDILIKHENNYIERSATPNRGTDDLYSYFEQNKQNTTGETESIYVQFFVQEDGSIEDISVISNVTPALAREAIRLVESYPNGWQPALSQGKAVKQRMVIPIQF